MEKYQDQEYFSYPSPPPTHTVGEGVGASVRPTRFGNFQGAYPRSREAIYLKCIPSGAEV